jgi:hypothetical protein
VSTIDTLHSQTREPRSALALSDRTVLALAIFAAALFIGLYAPSPAVGAPAAVPSGSAASGELLFYPCTSCHPVIDGTPSAALPNDFPGHQVTLEVHDVLGKGSKACLVCHDDPAKDPGKLRVIDGFVDIDADDAARVCYQCHSDKYKEWEVGIHGKRLPKCSSAGCHNPHSPSWIYAEPLLPFVGVGFQSRAVSERTTFTPLAGAPIDAPVTTPAWLRTGTMIGGLVVFGLLGFVIVGRPKR